MNIYNIKEAKEWVEQIKKEQQEIHLNDAWLIEIIKQIQDDASEYWWREMEYKKVSLLEVNKSLKRLSNKIQKISVTSINKELAE